MKMRILLYIALLGFLVGGGWLLRRQFLKDRAAALGFNPAMNRQIQTTTTSSDGKTTRTYTAAELEELKKSGKLPKNIDAKPISSAEAANQAAVQRSLKTIEEINRINAMNQRLIDQQQRNQKQHN